jgi:hypothetical protein
MEVPVMALSKTSLALAGSGVAAMLVVSVPAQAAPWAKSGDFVAHHDIQQVRWRGNRRGAYAAGAIGLGILGLAAAAAAAQGGGYDSDEGYGYVPSYGYGSPYAGGYAPSYGYERSYRYAPAYGYRDAYPPRRAYAPHYGQAYGPAYHNGNPGNWGRGGLTREQQSRDRMERGPK